MARHPRVTVYWDDAWSSTRQIDSPSELQEMGESWPLETTGFLVSRNKKCIVLATDRTGKDKTWRGMHHIPKVNVRRVEFLKPVEKAK